MFWGDQSSLVVEASRTGLACGEEDDLNDVGDEQREHQGCRDDVRREPELEQLVQVDERVNAAQRHGRVERVEEQAARLRVFESRRVSLDAGARLGLQRRQLLALQILSQQKTEREIATTHATVEERA